MNEYSIDDRGNVVDIYVSGEHTGRLDREAPAPPGIDWGYSFDGGRAEIKAAIAEGYSNEIAIAIIFEFLRGDREAANHACAYIAEVVQ